MLVNLIPSFMASIMPMTGVETSDFRHLAQNSAHIIIEYTHSVTSANILKRNYFLESANGAHLAKLFRQDLKVCYFSARQNVPMIDDHLNITDFKPIVKVNKYVSLATAPVAKGCLMSGFGIRTKHDRIHMHKGWDIANNDAVDVYASGDGIVLEAHFRNDYGNMILIDHGHGVYSRYAHLDIFEDGLEVGTQLKAGDTIGLMGTTAEHSVGRHLHYEILTGNYHTQMKSFGLSARRILKPQADTRIHF